MRLSIVLVPALALAASGCSAFSDERGAADGELTVAAAFYPLQFVTERVAGEHAEVTQLTQPGAEPHDLELTIRETAEITEADLVVYEEGFQPAVDDAVEQNAEGVALDAASVVDLIAVEESPEEHEEHEEDEHAEDAEDEHAADEHAEDEHAQDEHAQDEHAEDEHAEDEHGHDHGDLDPHFWQDPLRVADLADAVAEELAALDEEHADDYAANAAELRRDLEGLDAAFSSGLADCERDTIVVSHDAFGYLEKYDLHIAPIVGLSPDAEPTAAVLGELQQLIRTEGITTVFSEPLEPALGEGLAADLDLINGVLDPVEGLTDATAEEDYLSLMESNLEAIRTANACQ